MSTAILYTCVSNLYFANLLPPRWKQGLTGKQGHKNN